MPGAKHSIYLGNTWLRQGQFLKAFPHYRHAVRAIIGKKNLGEGRGRDTDVPWPENTYIINHTYHFLYCPIPKAANSSFRKLTLLLNDVNPSENVVKFMDDNKFTLRYYSKDEVEEIMASNEYFKFTIVRNPWQRLTSAYLNKFVVTRAVSFDKTAIDAHYVRCGMEPNYEKSITFRQFIEYICVTENKFLDQHWKPQYLFLGNTKTDFIGKFENLTDDFEYLKKRLNINLELPHKKKTPYIQQLDNNQNYSDYYPSELRNLKQQSKTYPQYQQFYTPDLIELVRQRYKEDIETFGYDFEHKF